MNVSEFVERSVVNICGDCVCVCVCVCVCARAQLLRHVRLFVTTWTVARQGPLSMGFSDKNTGVGCRFLFQGIFWIQGSNLRLASPALASRFFTTEPPGKPHRSYKSSFQLLFFSIPKMLGTLFAMYPTNELI